MDLRVFLKLDGSGFQQGLTQAKAAVGRFSDQALGGLKSQLAAAFTAGALIEFSRRTIEFAGNMRDLSDRLGVNVEWLQKMNYAAGKAGASAEDLAKFLGEVARSREAALANPKGPEAAAYGRLGMGAADIKNLPQQQFVEKLIAAFAGGVSVQSENDLRDVGGKAASKLIGAFIEGIDGAGPIIPEDLIDQLDNLGDSFFELKLALMSDVAPAITWVAEKFTWFTNQVKQAGTFLGAFSGVFGAWLDFMKGKISLNEMGAAVIAIRDETRRQVVSQDADQQDAMDRAQIARNEARERRRQREKSPPKYAAPEIKPEEIKAAEAAKPRIPSDSLVSVGNFLGGTSGLDRIVNATLEQNNILRQQTLILNQIVAAVRAFQTGSIVVP